MVQQTKTKVAASSENFVPRPKFLVNRFHDLVMLQVDQMMAKCVIARIDAFQRNYQMEPEELGFRNALDKAAQSANTQAVVWAQGGFAVNGFHDVMSIQMNTEAAESLVDMLDQPQLDPHEYALREKLGNMLDSIDFNPRGVSKPSNAQNTFVKA